MHVFLTEELILFCINVCRVAAVLVTCKCFSASNKLPVFRAPWMHRLTYLNPKISSIPSKINTAHLFIHCYSKTYFNTTSHLRSRGNLVGVLTIIRTIRPSDHCSIPGKSKRFASSPKRLWSQPSILSSGRAWCPSVGENNIGVK